MTPDERAKHAASVRQLAAETWPDPSMHSEFTDMRIQLAVLQADVKRLVETIEGRRAPWWQFIASAIAVFMATALIANAFYAPLVTRLHEAEAAIVLLKEADQRSLSERQSLERQVAEMKESRK